MLRRIAGSRVAPAFLAPILLSSLACDGRSPGTDAEPTLAIVGAVLLDPVTGTPSEPSTVLVAGDRIVAVEAMRTATVPSGAVEVAAEGTYLLPGLWDLHTHLAHLDDHAPPLLVTQGVLGVRDLGAVPEEIERIRARIESGELLGPRVVRAGPTLNGAPNAPHHRVIESPEAAREAVSELAAAGVDLLKTHNATGRESYFALLDAAREAGLTVAGHVPTAVSPLEACEAGQASIEHIVTLFEGTYVTRFEDQMAAARGVPEWLESEGAELADCFAAQGTLFVPTLRAYELRAHWAAEHDAPAPAWRYLSAPTREEWLADEPSELDRRADVIALRQSVVDTGITFVRMLVARGAPIGAGTDLAGPGLLPGFSLHAEVRLLAEAMTPAEALRAATRGPGSKAGGDPLQGRLVPGAPADLVLLGGNAFEDLAALEDIRAVVLRGRWLDRGELDRVLDGLESD
jgi:imidazolonepropionase-like amidohydrolase